MFKEQSAKGEVEMLNLMRTVFTPHFIIGVLVGIYGSRRLSNDDN